MVEQPLRPDGACQRPRIFLLLLAIMLAVAPASAWAQTSLSRIFGTSKPTKPRYTRVTIDLRQQSRYEIFSLNNPNRVIIEMDQVGMRLPKLNRSKSNGLVKKLRAGQYAPGRSRIVIDVSEPVIVKNSQLIPHPLGAGVQLELLLAPFKPIGRRAKAALKNRPTFGLGGPLITQPPVPRPAHSLKRGGRNTYKPLIVIDPGHGGKDPGARKFGLSEKNVVLAFSHTLKNLLGKTGRYRVKMTRNKDVFISLDKRREFAEAHTAALFIAVHADYARTNAGGATIYSLRKKVANRLRRATAARAAQQALSRGVMKFATAAPNDIRAVRGILGDLAQREVHANLERTNIFTKIAIEHMGATTTMRGRPHREAAFKVLKTAKVPSVLIELAYVSNRRDAARLKSRRWRQQVSGSLVKAIDKYFSHSASQIAY